MGTFRTRAVSSGKATSFSSDGSPFFKKVLPPDGKKWGDTDRLTPAFELKVFGADEDPNIASASGKPAKRGKELMAFAKELVIEEDETMATNMRLTLNDPDFVVSNSDLLNPGNEIEFEFGYSPSPAWYGHRGIIVGTDPVFPREGIPTHTVKAYDGRYILINDEYIPGMRGGLSFNPRRRGKGKPPTIFKKMTDTEMVDEICAFYGLAFEGQPTDGKRSAVKKKDTTYWEFIQQLAKRNNFTAWVDWDTTVGWVLHFMERPFKFDQGYTFEYREGEKGTLLEFDPSEDIIKQVTDVEVVHFDRRQRKIAIFELREKKHRGVTLKRTSEKQYPEYYGSEVRFRMGGRVISAFNNRPFKSKKEAKKFAEVYIRNRQQDYMSATGTVIGVENLRPRQIHKFLGVGKYSGEYYLKQVTQRFADSRVYETSFVAYRIPPSNMESDFSKQTTAVKAS